MNPRTILAGTILAILAGCGTPPVATKAVIETPLPCVQEKHIVCGEAPERAAPVTSPRPVARPKPVETF